MPKTWFVMLWRVPSFLIGELDKIDKRTGIGDQIQGVTDNIISGSKIVPEQ